MKVSCIVVTYNGIKWAEKCFSSLRTSDYPLNIIAIDNGSTDGTQLYIKDNFPEVDFLQSDKNVGFGQANNIAITKALEQGAEFIFLLNQDAYLYQGSIKDVIENFKQDRKIGIISPIHFAGDGKNLDFAFFDYVNPKKAPNFLGEMVLNRSSKLYDIEFVNAAAWMVKSDVIKKIGMFHPAFDHYGEDNEYIKRLFSFKYSLKISSEWFIIHDRIQSRESSSKYFFKDELFKRNQLIKLTQQEATISEITFLYSKVILLSILKFQIRHAFKSFQNLIYIRKKARKFL